jgi:hypothetical protein
MMKEKKEKKKMSIKQKGKEKYVWENKKYI